MSDAGALDHDEVLLDLSVVGEPAHGVDGLVSQVVPENHYSLHIKNSSVVKFILYGQDNVFEYQRTLLYRIEFEQNFSALFSPQIKKAANPDAHNSGLAGSRSASEGKVISGSPQKADQNSHRS